MFKFWATFLPTTLFFEVTKKKIYVNQLYIGHPRYPILSNEGKLIGIPSICYKLS